MTENESEPNASEKSKKEMKIERNKQIIIETAEKLIEKFGFEAITMDQIADESFFSKTTLYKYFHSKEEVYISLATKAYSKLVEEFEKELVADLRGIDITYNMGNAFYRFFKQYPLYRKALDYMAQKNINPEQYSKDLLQSLNIQQTRFLKVWIEAIEKGVRDGSINPKFPPALNAFIIGQMTNGFLDHLSHAQSILQILKLGMDDAFEAFLQIVKQGIANPDPRSPLVPVSSGPSLSSEPPVSSGPSLSSGPPVSSGPPLSSGPPVSSGPSVSSEFTVRHKQPHNIKKNENKKEKKN